MKPTYLGFPKIVSTFRLGASTSGLDKVVNLTFRSPERLSGSKYWSAQGSISLACTPNTPFTIGLNGGLSNAASPTARLMTKGAESLTYGLYLDAGFSQPRGAAGGSGSVSSGTGTGSTQTLTVYARAPAQATPSPGAYTDTVVATLTY
jgi:spore coat protein U-like protein